MTVTIERVQISFIRAISLPSTIGVNTGPGPHLSTFADYAKAFSQAAQPNAVWRLPWATDPISRLWCRNLQRANLAAVDPGKAWKLMAPLWSTPANPVNTLGGDVVIDRYLLPGALSVVVTVTLTGDFTAKTTLAAAVAARRDPVYLRQPNEAPIGLTNLHRDLLTECQGELFGTPDPDSAGDLEPLSIVSVLAASGSSAKSVVEENNPVHRLLRGLCAFDANSLSMPVPAAAALGSARLTQSERSNGATLLAVHRGRALWSPAKMFDRAGQAELGRYHDHLTVSTAIAEALLAFIADARATTATQAGVAIGKLAVLRLGMLYGPARDIWSSTSIRRQIDESPAIPRINALRTMYTWKPLAARTPAP